MTRGKKKFFEFLCFPSVVIKDFCASGEVWTEKVWIYGQIKRKKIELKPMLVRSLVVCYPRKVFNTRANQLIDWLIDLLLSSPKQFAYASNLFLQMVDELCFVFSLPNRHLLVFRLSSGENFLNVAAAKFFASCQLEIKT